MYTTSKSVSKNSKLDSKNTATVSKGGHSKVVRKIGIEGLYYITHKNNIPSILEKGILSHALIEELGINFTPIYDTQIVGRRQGIRLPSGESLWKYANLYFQPRNAMLYRIVNNAPVDDIAILLVEPKIINGKDIFITDGNAASGASNIYSSNEGRLNIPSIRSNIDREWWADVDGTKRKMMAECLVPNKIKPEDIKVIYVASDRAKAEIERQVNCKIEISVDSGRFFQPQWKRPVANNISLVKGDMFLSRMQTLTISVNCVGVMGKGLASTTKYRFPDVYVKYEDICKKKKLQMGRPYIHRRETSILYDLSDDPNFLNNPDSQTWFLIFPTKNHWKQNSNIDDIEKGMQWLLTNYKSEGIKSLALPALGCGLGGLDWKDVGPMMCKYLAELDVQSAIYLPIDRVIPDEYLNPEFLLKDWQAKQMGLHFDK